MRPKRSQYDSPRSPLLFNSQPASSKQSARIRENPASSPLSPSRLGARRIDSQRSLQRIHQLTVQIRGQTVRAVIPSGVRHVYVRGGCFRTRYESMQSRVTSRRLLRLPHPLLCRCGSSGRTGFSRGTAVLIHLGPQNAQDSGRIGADARGGAGCGNR